MAIRSGRGRGTECTLGRAVIGGLLFCHHGHSLLLAVVFAISATKQSNAWDVMQLEDVSNKNRKTRERSETIGFARSGNGFCGSAGSLVLAISAFFGLQAAKSKVKSL